MQHGIPLWYAPVPRQLNSGFGNTEDRRFFSAPGLTLGARATTADRGLCYPSTLSVRVHLFLCSSYSVRPWDLPSSTTVHVY